MLLVAGPMPELLKFFQILGWIILPVLAITCISTIILHKRRKRSAQKPVLIDKSNAEHLAFKNEAGELVYFDHSPLIRNYKKQLSTAKAKYNAVENDLAMLRERYSATARYARILLLTHKTNNMENANGQLSTQLHAEIEKIAKENVAEKQAFQQKIGHLEQSIVRLTNTNKSLADQLKLTNASEDEKISALHNVNEENADLKEKLMNLEYLEDVLQEKKTQISFLQEQLEQRIRTSHQSEQHRAKIAAELDRFRAENLSVMEKFDSLSLNAAQAAEKADHFEKLSLLQRSELEEKEQLLAAGAGEISYLQSQHLELKNQVEMTAAALADSSDRESRLKDLLTQEQGRSAHLHYRLQSANTLLQRIQKEILHVLPEDGHSSLVIPLHAEARSLDAVSDEQVPVLV